MALAMAHGTLTEATAWIAKEQPPICSWLPVDDYVDLTPTPSSPVGPPPSHAYRRMLEELALLVSPNTAEALLEQCVQSIGATPDSVLPYDLRWILIEQLPERLTSVLPPEDAASVLSALESTIVDMQAPRCIPTELARSRSRFPT